MGGVTDGITSCASGRHELIIEEDGFLSSPQLQQEYQCKVGPLLGKPSLRLVPTLQEADRQVQQA